MDQVREIVKHWSPTKLGRLRRALGENPAKKISDIISELQLFRDPPSKEDLEYRLEELTIQVSPSIRVEASRIWSICNSFWESTLSDLKKIPRYGAWKMQYLDGKEHVCTFGSTSFPSLLWTALDRPSGASEGYASRIFDQPMMHLAVIFGASGVGKTRTILEWGLERNCIILTGHAESTVGGYWGSRDVLAVANHMLKLFGTDKPITNRAALSCCVGALLFVRFYIWHKCKEARPEIVNYDWMCLQLEFFKLGVKDIFELLTVELMNTFVVEGEKMHWDEVSKMFWQMVEELQMKIGWNGFIAIDECQEINKYLSNRFASVTLGQGQRSILNPLLVELSKCPRTQAIVVSGTGATLLELKLAFQSGSVKQRLDYSEVLGFKGFDNKIEMETYANRFVDIHNLDMEKIWTIYRGRYRFFVTALERYMIHQCAGGTQFFVDFATLLSTSTGAKLQLFRSVKDDVVKLFQRNNPCQVSFVIDLVLAVYFGGMSILHFYDVAALKLVEYGVGRLMLKDCDGAAFSYNRRLPFNEDYGYASVKIDEPIVHSALLSFLKSDKVEFEKLCINRFVRGAATFDSKIGEDYELYASAGLGNFFNGRAPVDMLPDGFDEIVPNVYKEKTLLVESDDPMITCLVQDVCPNYRLLDWINAIECNGSFATYFRTAPENDCGPDVILILKVPSIGKYMPVLCQLKTGEKVSIMDALSSLCIDKMYKHNKRKTISNPRDEEAVEKLRNWCATGYIQLVVTTPMGSAVKKLNSGCKVNPERHVKIRSLPCVKPLYGVVDGNNAHLFLDKWLCRAIENLKKDTKRRSCSKLDI